MSIAPVAPRRSRRFWSTVAAFAVANVLAWVAWDRYVAAARRGHLRVAAFEPGDNAVVSPTATLRWRFDADVLPTDVYARPPGRSNPPVAGRWSWESPRTLAFAPATGLPRATPVTFTLAPDLLISLTGAGLDRPYATQVRPAPLAVTSVRQASAVDGAYVIELAFTDRVAPGDVLAHLTVTDAVGHPVHCHLHGQAAGTTVRVRTDLLPDAAAADALTVDLSPGLVGAAGPLGLAQAYHASVAVTHALAALEMSAAAPTRGRPWLRVDFSGPVDPERLARVLSVDPAVPFTTVAEGHAVSLVGDFHNGTRYTVRLADPPADVVAADRGLFPRPGTLSAFVPDAGRDCWLDTDQGYLSTAGNRTLLAHAVNVDRVRVTATRVYDDNLVAWRNAAAGRGDSVADADAYARPAAERTVDCPGPRNARRDVPIRLDELLPPTLARSGVWRVTIAASNGPADADAATSGRSYYGSRTSALVTLSDVGLTAKRTRTGLVAWATSLRSAAPLAGIRVRAFSDKNQPLGSAVTGADGLAHIDDVHPVGDEAVAVLLADTADASELTWLDLRRTGWQLADADTAGAAYLRDGHTAFVYADRGVYRPGETAHLRAIVRGPGDVAPKQTFPVRWRFRRPDLRQWRTVDAMLDGDGAVAADVPLPDDLPTGEWAVDLALPGADAPAFGSATFLVEEFVPNRLKVGLMLGTAKRVPVDTGTVPVDVRADYLFGRPAAGLGVSVASRLVPVPFAPTGWDGWTFGDAADVHAEGTNNRRSRRGHRADPPTTLAGTLDDAGKYHGTLDAAALTHADDDRPGRYRGPWRLTAEASVAEAGGRAVTAAGQVDVDAVPAYVAVRHDGPAVPGESCPFRLARVRPDGVADDAVADVAVRLLRESWNTVVTYREGAYQYDSSRVLSPVASATVHCDAGTATWVPVPPVGGRYVLEATDAGGAVTTTAFYAYAAGGWDDSADGSHPDRLDVRVLGPGEPDVPGPDARTRPAAPPQRAGSTARVLVAAPFAGRLLLTVETDDVVRSQVIDMPASHVVVPVDVTAACAPGAFVTATVLRPVDPDAKWRSHRAYGVARLNVDPADRKLTVAIDAPAELRPMRSLDVRLTVTDPDGRPAADAAVAVAAVDEGTCAVTDFHTPDPLAFLTARRALGVASADVYGLLMPETAASDVGGDGSRGTDGEASSARHRSPVGGRRVRPVALAWVTARTDAAGHAVASFPVPAFQGQLRVMAVAHTADRVGSADRHVTVRSPLLVQTSWPRFAAPGDRFTVPVVVFNNRPVAGTAAVTVEPIGDDRLLAYDGSLPPVPLSAKGQGRCDLAVTVGRTVGVARVRLTATMGDERYTEDLELPVRPAAAMTQVGGIARGTTAAPTPLTGFVQMLSGTGSVRVDVTPWPTLNLTRGLDYLDRYPYGCAEQTTSTLFPLVALGDVGRKLDPTRFDPRRIHDKVRAGVVQLIGMQTADGGLAMWPGGSDPWPWASVYAAHFLTAARADGHPVPDDFYDGLLAYVRHLLDRSTDAADGLEVQAYAAYVLALAGRPDRPAMSRLVELATAADRPAEAADAHQMRGDAQLFLATAWLLAGRRDLAEDMLPATMPQPRVGRQHDGNLGSPVRDRAIQILTLEQVEPDRPDLPDLVQRLADDGIASRWASTQDVAYATLAVGQYLQVARHAVPYDTAKLLLNDAVVGASDRAGPLTWTGDAGRLAVRLTGPADAVGHVGWLQTGVPMTPPPAASHGLAVHRRYLSQDGRPITTARSGDLVRVELTLDGPADLANVVLEDLLPAGLEVENGRLATAAHDLSDAAAGDPPAFGGVTEVRDDRVVVVGRIGATGHGRATVLARAATPGVYVDPPARAEAMYDLNTNGSTAANTFTVTGGGGSAVVAAE